MHPGPGPAPPTISYGTGQGVANGAFTALGVVGGNYAVRIYTSQPVYVFVDLTGAVVRADLGQTQLAAPQRVAAAVGRIRTKIAKLGSR